MSPKSHRRTTSELIQDIGPVAVFIRQRRKLLGYSQEELALKTGVGLRFLKDLELGKKTARMDKVNQVLAYFGAQLEPVPMPPPTESREVES